ncbi:hypothetical protein [Streptomyces olivaceoviridis]|uniref:hypothetical protein n=1 Tax=Streptomyces olivaceoviridis TaxID=1921 RepID=UPI0036C3C2B0
MDTPQPEYDSYQISVPGTWTKSGFVSRRVTVYGTRPGELPEVVAKGWARVRHLSGEPQDVRVEGFEPLHDWDKLSGDMSPGEWVCTAVKTT